MSSSARGTASPYGAPGAAEFLVQEVVDVLVDTAYELRRRRHLDGAWSKSGRAAATGVLVDPGDERLWRLRMHVRISELGLDLEREATSLLAALDQDDNSGIEQSRDAL